MFAGGGVRAMGTNESNTYRRTQRENTVFGVRINAHNQSAFDTIELRLAMFNNKENLVWKKNR